jgi:Rhamnogalacturonan I lyases beta-sheet domain
MKGIKGFAPDQARFAKVPGRLSGILVCMALAFSSLAQRQMEWLGRGVVAIHESDKNVFVSWRLLGSDPEGIAFNLYRVTGGKTVKLNLQPLTKGTNWLDKDADPSQPNSYYVTSVQGEKESDTSRHFNLTANAQPYLSIHLQTPPGYAPNDVSVGDLDGDGEYEIVLHQAGRGKDNSQAGYTDPPIIQAYKLDGRMLWQINLGKSIREGAHYTQFMVYDLDGDGRAEIAMKTADGTIDGTGKVIGDSSKDFRNKDGRILDGPEYFTIFDGLTGAALATTDFIPPEAMSGPGEARAGTDIMIVMVTGWIVSWLASLISTVSTPAWSCAAVIMDGRYCPPGTGARANLVRAGYSTRRMGTTLFRAWVITIYALPMWTEMERTRSFMARCALTITGRACIRPVCVMVMPCMSAIWILRGRVRKYSAYMRSKTIPKGRGQPFSTPPQAKSYGRGISTRMWEEGWQPTSIPVTRAMNVGADRKD